MMKTSLLATVTICALALGCSKKNEQTSEQTPAASGAEEAAAISATYSKVASDSALAWRATHLGGVQPRFGKVRLKSAQITVAKGALKQAEVVIDMDSITVENFAADEAGKKTKLTQHLKNADFFDVEKFPSAKFELASATKAQGAFNYAIKGALTIKQVSKPVVFKANVAISDTAITIKSEKFVVDRSDWSLTYHAEGSEGVPLDYLIADDIEFSITATINK